MTCKQIKVVAAIILFTLACGCNRSPEARRDKFLAKGKEFFHKQDYSRAILEFKNATQVAPKDAEPYYQISLASSAAGDLRGAVIALRAALTLDPKHPEAQLKLAQMMAGATEKVWLEDAESRLTALIENSPATPDMLNTLALTELKLGKTEDAIENLQQALVKAPQQLISSVMLARAKVSQKDLKGAEEVLKKACEADPNAAEPRVVLGEFYLSQKRMGEAEAEFHRALQVNAKSGPALMNVAKLQNSLGRKQEAEGNFKRLTGLGEQIYKPVYGLFLFQEGRGEEAVREFERLTKENPGDRAARTLLVAAYRSLNKTPLAEKILDDVLRKNPKDMDALLQRGEICLADGKYLQAEENFNKVLRLNPNSAEVHYVLAKLHQARGAVLRYRQELSEALRLNSYLLAVRLELAQNLLRTNDSGALDILNATPNAQKQLPIVTVNRNWALWASGDLQEMRKGIDSGLSKERSTELLLQDGMWKLRTGNPTGARAAIEEALRINPVDLRALMALKQTYLAQKQAPLALQKVKEYASRNSKSAPVQEFLGTMLLANGDRAGARAAFTAAKSAEPRSTTVDLALVQLDAVESKWDDAAAKLNATILRNARNTTARLWLGEIEAVRGNYEAALGYFRQVVEADPTSVDALNNLAYLLADYRKQPDDALKYAERAQELAPDDPYIADTLGWILYQKGLYPLAVKHLERAASPDGNAISKYHLAMAYAKSGNLKHARATLDVALKQSPNVPEAKMAAAVVGQSN
jgi:tetratricopeptide (TPR) repeat protein